MVAAAALAAGLIGVASLAVETNRYFAPTDSVSVMPVIAATPEVPIGGTTSMANAALASVPTGIPVWPAVLMVGQARMRFASMESRDTEMGR